LLKTTGAKEAYDIVEDIRHSVEHLGLATKTRGDITITVSAGLSVRPLDSLEDMLDESDALLYKAKTSGKNRIAI
jgi:diguanylate cyclase (GGDEF)-like protein